MASEHLNRNIRIDYYGLFGVGSAMEPSNSLAFPSPTNSIFAVIAEETGLIGSAIHCHPHLLLLWRGLVISQNAADLESFWQGGSMDLYGSHHEHYGDVVNLIPFTGSALPFISSGGSTLSPP